MGKKTIEIRVRATVEEGSVEEKLLEFLNDKAAVPFERAQMWIKAAKMCWLPLVLKYKKYSDEEVEASLYDSDYSWELHWEFLLSKARMRPSRIRHRVNAVNASVKELAVEMEHLRKDNGLVNQPGTDARNGKSQEPEGSSFLNDTDSPKPFNLFGNSIISKQD